MKCKECDFCEQRGRQQFQQGRGGKKWYWCEHPKTKALPISVFGNKAEKFIGFGEHTWESPLTVKTSPRWCPLKYKNQ